MGSVIYLQSSESTEEKKLSISSKVALYIDTIKDFLNSIDDSINQEEITRSKLNVYKNNNATYEWDYVNHVRNNKNKEAYEITKKAIINIAITIDFLRRTENLTSYSKWLVENRTYWLEKQRKLKNKIEWLRNISREEIEKLKTNRRKTGQIIPFIKTED